MLCVAAVYFLILILQLQVIHLLFKRFFFNNGCNGDLQNLLLCDLNTVPCVVVAVYFVASTLCYMLLGLFILWPQHCAICCCGCSFCCLNTVIWAIPPIMKLLQKKKTLKITKVSTAYGRYLIKFS